MPTYTRSDLHVSNATIQVEVTDDFKDLGLCVAVTIQGATAVLSLEQAKQVAQCMLCAAETLASLTASQAVNPAPEG